MSSIMLEKNGSLGLVLTDQIEMTAEELAEITRLERTTSQLKVAESTIRAEITKLEVKLMSNPDYTQMLKMREKVQMARKMHKETQTVMNYKVSEALKKNGIASPAEFYAGMLPDAEVKTGKRGRPRLTAHVGGVK